MNQRQRWTLLAVSIAAFMLLLDLTIVTVALTDIQESLEASFDDLQWVVDAYALTLAAFLLTAGTLADRMGRRKVFLIGLIVFTLSSLGCGLAWSPEALLVFRGLQGVGGAVLLAAGPSLLAQEFALGAERNKAFAAFGGSAGLAIAAGPLVGGALTSIDWRWIFLINLPVGLLCLYVVLTKLRDERDAAAQPVDWIGAVLLCAGLFLVTYGLMRGEADGWTSGRILGCLLLSVAILGAFVLWQSRTTAPLMDLRLFANPSFSGLAVATLLAYAALFPALFFSTLFLQRVQSYSAFDTGVRMLPLTIAMFIASALAAPLAAKISPRLLMTVGLALTGGGLLLLTGLEADKSWTQLLAGFIVCGFGAGVFNVVRSEATVSLVPPSRSGEASGVGSTFQEVGVAFGIAVLGSLFHNQVVADAEATGVPEGAVQDAAMSINTFTDALDDVFLWGGIIALAAALLILVTFRHTPQPPASGTGSGAGSATGDKSDLPAAS
ncbi:MFS transporter [Streptomyces sp. NA04227]|uniref:MFS transporter n=1 Tax=Streptomyces sp. NA04227 TaxID=2742136 RepID=UPI000A203DB9|nr:MFS transporter [Streptomyces sp. NA04227]ARM20253.1 multidrug resistance protein [Streptomyces sp.]QKW07480.1 MFS transporter [Streptomyces sp. NA04227]